MMQISTVRYEIPFTILITVLIAGLGLFDNQINRVEGVILWILMILRAEFTWSFTIL